MADKLVGKVFDYYGKVGVIAMKLDAPLKVGDKIKIKGGTRDFEQAVESMQIEHKPVKEAKKGSDVGIKVNQECRRGDSVFKVS